MVHACEMANEAEKDIAIRRASGFNELFEAALKKESEQDAEPGSGVSPEDESGSGKGKEKQQFGPEVEELKKLAKQLVKQSGGMGRSKWIWGVDLTEDDLRGLIRGADHQSQVSHTGYDKPHSASSASESSISAALDPVNLEDPHDPDLRFEELSRSITIINDLRPDEIPAFSALLATSGDDLVSEPDSVIEAFSKRAKAQAIKTKKLLIQAEVDQPVSYHDYGSEFVLRTALIPRRPWLAPRLPIILPPTTNSINHVMPIDSDTNPKVPDNIIMSDPDQIPDHLNITDSDEVAGHLIISDSDSTTSLFPVSDDAESHSMDVVRSNEEGVTISQVNSDSESDSIPDNILFSSDPTDSPMIGVERDPNTGRFTAASFANFPDQLLG